MEISKLLKRFRTKLVDGITGKDLEKIDLQKYWSRFESDIKKKKVYVLITNTWTESFLEKWFSENFRLLKFQEVYEQRTKKYNDLKHDHAFFGFPDFLGKRDEKILRIELECFSSQFKFMHKPDYCDVVLCYEKDEPIEGKEVYELKGILGYKDIILSSEIWSYMFIKYPEFKEEIQRLGSQLLMRGIGQRILNETTR